MQDAMPKTHAASDVKNGGHGSKYFGIEWVPWNEPFHRRLETAAVFLGTLTPVLGIFAGLPFAVFLFFSQFAWIAVLYFIWMWYDRHTACRGGRRWTWLRKSSVFRLLRDYFPLSLVKTVDLDPSQKYIFGLHPHGISLFGGLCLISDATGFEEKFPGIRPYITTMSANYWFPVMREWFLAVGAVSCSKQSIEYILRETGTGVVILIGGVPESCDMNQHQYSLVLKKRKGFIKMALKQGAHLVPCFGFGQKSIYPALSPDESGSRVRRFQIKMQTLLPCSRVLFNGRGLFNYTIGMLPRRTRLTTVVGQPIIVEKDENPTTGKIAALHDQYMLELRKLFEENKVQYGDADKTLLFVD